MNHPRARLIVVVFAIVVVGAWFWRATNFDPGINFLPHHAPANWILYPNPPDPEMHSAVPVWTEFRREFVLEAQPGVATLELRAFKNFQVAINGRVLTNPVAAEANWKRESHLDLARLLKPGTNLLSLMVTNRTGPPALWAVLRSGETTLTTDSSWSASLVGAVWQPAAIAGQPRKLAPGNPLFGGETAGPSFRRVGVYWLAGFAIIWVSLLGWEKYSRRAELVARMTRLGSAARGGWILVGLVGVAWLVLMSNNLPRLPSLFGFDTDGHVEYIRFVQEHGRLPLANEGWQMYQPPLYYLLSVGLLDLANLTTADDAATLALRAMSGCIGYGHLIFLFLCLRRLFPNAGSNPTVGLLFAACLPAQLCISQYITNEGLAATLAAATLYFTVRIVQSESPGHWLWWAAGGCLGLALLSKFSAVILAPFVLGMLAWHAFGLKASSAVARWRGPATAVVSCLLICGWHYGRVWAQFGNPLVGNWSPESGFAWWQENGFTTAQYFSSFGRALTSPLFGGFDSLGDGLYSTLWADSLCSGGTRIGFRPAWNYSLMVAGGGLAFVPGALVFAGFLKLLWGWLRNASMETLLWPGLVGAYVLAIAAMTLRVPSYAQAKAIYGLAALLPFCVCLLTGLNLARQASAFLHRLCLAALLLWMVNSFATYWIRNGSATTHDVLAANFLEVGRPADALVEAERALQLDPQLTTAGVRRSTALRALNRFEEASQQIASLHAQPPEDPVVLLELAPLAAARGDYATAATLARRAAAQSPDHPQAVHNAALWSFQAGRTDEAVALCRQALRIRFANHALHFLLSKALAVQGHDAESLRHLRLAASLKPDWPVALNDLAWTLATHPAAEFRNGGEAVTLAERACALTGQQQPQLLGTLAAAYAEAGRFADAVRTAQTAAQLAVAAGLSQLAERNEALLKLYRAGKPYHEPPSAPAEAGTIQ